MSREDALKAIRYGAIAACISGTITIGLFIIATVTNAADIDDIGVWNDPLIIIDIVLVFVLAWFIYKKSRAAAVCMFLYFVFSKIYILFESQSFGSIPFALIFLFLYGRAVWGSFIFHKIEKAENPDYKKSRKWIVVLVSVLISIFLLLFGLGLMTMTGFMPSTEVQAGSDVHKSHIDKLVSAEIISSPAEVEYFYSAGLFSVLEEGVIITPGGVTMYFQEGDEQPSVYEMTYEQIKKVEIVEKGDFVTDEIYLLSSDDPDIWMSIGLSIEEDGHLPLIELLRSRIIDTPDTE